MPTAKSKPRTKASRQANPLAWNLTDLAKVKQNGIKVMSTFSCGGGSTMGYKRAGCTVVAANDIDKEMEWHYKRNLKPPLYYLCPIADLAKPETTLDPILFDLDILDGSPPCSTFSMNGKRARDWGKEKHFREGQAKQVLSDLFFDFIDLAERLRPKTIIAENVRGMLLTNARGYVRMIVKRLRALDYTVQVFLINAMDCGVPQSRERVFFCARRNDIKGPPLTLQPEHRPIYPPEAFEGLAPITPREIEITKPGGIDLTRWPNTMPGDTYADASTRVLGKNTGFSMFRLSRLKVAGCLTASDSPRHWSECRKLTFRESKRLGSFPDDYQARNDNIGKYMIGMSVPPKMTEFVARAVIDQWLLPAKG